ncbi:MAG: bifunctional methylenetetrahydrofolate dehydrogenase/methenyltetrahydrofolate cyclohydrolase FolD [Rickettsiales bacterium]
MTATIIDGKARAAALRKEVAQGVATLKSSRNVTPGLAVILVGEDPASQVYVRNKNNACKEVGMNSLEILKPSTITQDELLAEVRKLNADPTVHGILVQLPLPKHIDANTVIDAIDPKKDVDGFHVVNAGKLAVGQDGFVPCTPLGCLLLLKEQLGDLSGKHAVIVGRSNIVGKPMAQLLLKESCTVTICHSKTHELHEEVKRADIIVAAIGQPNFIKGTMIKPGAVVIDVGINRGTDGKLVGDVDFAAAKEIALAITPVPGGVGPMTIACLLKNTLQAASC